MDTMVSNTSGHGDGRAKPIRTKGAMKNQLLTLAHPALKCGDLKRRKKNSP